MRKTSKLTILITPLLLLGFGCAPGGSGTYVAPQQPVSQLTAEQRSQIRDIMRNFSDVRAKTPEEIRAIQPLAINVMQVGDDIVPFPEEQFRLATPVECPDDCPEDHYVGAEALTLDLGKLSEPQASCEWGMASAATPMEVDHEDLILWLDAYVKTRR